MFFVERGGFKMSSHRTTILVVLTSHRPEFQNSMLSWEFGFGGLTFVTCHQLWDNQIVAKLVLYWKAYSNLGPIRVSVEEENHPLCSGFVEVAQFKRSYLGTRGYNWREFFGRWDDVKTQNPVYRDDIDFDCRIDFVWTLSLMNMINWTFTWHFNLFILLLCSIGLWLYPCIINSQSCIIYADQIGKPEGPNLDVVRFSGNLDRTS